VHGPPCRGYNQPCKYFKYIYCIYGTIAKGIIGEQRTSQLCTCQCIRGGFGLFLCITAAGLLIILGKQDDTQRDPFPNLYAGNRHPEPDNDNFNSFRTTSRRLDL
jgi:hypothetical protein